MKEAEKIADKSAKPGSWKRVLGGGFALLVLGSIIYVRTHPLVFNESFFTHAHCMKDAGMSLLIYAHEHDGVFPFHTNGYGDALALLMRDDGPGDPAQLTGPGYDADVFYRALTNDFDIPEEECGRVFVQGLTTKSNPDIAIFFDKIPSPGGDHCHLFKRMTAPLVREVWWVGGGMRGIPETEWPEFTRRQIDLLVDEGYSREEAESLYLAKPSQPIHKNQM